MKRLTIYEKKLVATAYPLVDEMLEFFNLSDNSIEDWHGTICVWICESVVYWNKTEKKNPDVRHNDFLAFVKSDLIKKIEANIQKINTEKLPIRPSGLLKGGNGYSR